MEDNNTEEKLSELTEVINLINFNSVEEISEYFQTLYNGDLSARSKFRPLLNINCVNYYFACI